jgi:adenylate kinase family enzyme
MKNTKKLFVFIIAGPPGAGKTTLSKLLVKHYNCDYVSEDELAKSLFPGLLYAEIENFPDKLKLVMDGVLKRTKQIFNNGKSVVVDRINLEKEFIEEAKKVFRTHLAIIILWPPTEVTIQRDLERECWTSGEQAIKLFYKKYEALKPIIGVEHYLDNSHQTSEETFRKLVAILSNL